MQRVKGIVIGGPAAGKEVSCKAPYYYASQRTQETIDDAFHRVGRPPDTVDLVKRITYRVESLHVPDHGPIHMWVPEGVTILAAILELFEGYAQNERRKVDHGTR